MPSALHSFTAMYLFFCKNEPHYYEVEFVNIFIVALTDDVRLTVAKQCTEG